VPLIDFLLQFHLKIRARAETARLREARGQQAEILAERLLWTMRADSKLFSFTLPPNYAHLRENDLVSITVEGRTFTIMLQSVEVGNDYQIVCEGSLEAAELVSFGV